MTKFKQICLFSVGLIGSLLSTSANASTLYLNFYDANKHQLGSGQFSFDESKTVCVPLSSGSCIEVRNPLTNFSANIQGVGWGLDDIDRWWSANGQDSGQGPTGRNGGIEEGSWFFGDSVMGTSQFVMFMPTTSANAGRGSWVQSITPNEHPPSGLFGSGIWTAWSTPTPIPAGWWLFASGLIVLFSHTTNRKRITKPI